ncbi:hypothetical protein D3Z46_13675 [Bacteroides sartorii]|nr:hypothetical protein [Phocaeicola sartorii]
MSLLLVPQFPEWRFYIKGCVGTDLSIHPKVSPNTRPIINNIFPTQYHIHTIMAVCIELVSVCIVYPIGQKLAIFRMRIKLNASYIFNFQQFPEHHPRNNAAKLNKIWNNTTLLGEDVAMQK